MKTEIKQPVAKGRGFLSGGKRRRAISEHTAVKALVLVAFLLAIPLYGQNGTSPGRVLHRIEQVQERLERVREALGENAPQQAIDLLNQAEELLSRASDNYENGDISAALALADQANSLIEQALRVKRTPSAEQRQAQREIERCRQMAEQLAPKITTLGQPQLSDMFTAAREILSRAEKEYDSGNFKLAASLARQSLDMFRKMWREISGGVDPEKVADMLDYTDELLENLKEEIGTSSGKTASLVDAAEKLQQSAKEAFERGDFRAAADLTLSARRKIQAARKNIPTNSESMLRQIENLRRAAEKLNLDQTTTNKIEQLLSAAEKSIQGGNTADARSKIAAVRQLIAAAESSGKENVSRESATEALQITEEVINSANPSTDNGRKLLEQAKKLQTEARRNLENGNYSSALNKTRVAKQLAEQAK